MPTQNKVHLFGRFSVYFLITDCGLKGGKLLADKSVEYYLLIEPITEVTCKNCLLKHAKKQRQIERCLKKDYRR